MNVYKTTGLLVTAASFAAAVLIAQDPGVPETGAPPEPFTEAELMQTYGFLVSSQVGLRDMDLNRDQIEAFLDGFRLALETTEPPFEFEEIGPQLQAFLQEKQEVASARAAEAGRLAEEEFFSELDERDDVERLESGLRYEIVEEGDGETAGLNDTVLIHYRGSLISGETFDSSYERGQPAEFPVTGVIPGMSEGLQMLPVGSEAILYIPADLGYGNRGQASIPPGSTLIFEIEILGIVD